MNAEKERTVIREPERDTPVTHRFTVAVAGGGIAGCAAAVAAARMGASVCLIEKENMPGGLATLGLVVIYLPLCDGRGTQLIAGLGEELLHLSIKYGPGDVPEPWQQGGSAEERKNVRYRLTFNAASFALALEELLLKEGVTLFYDTRVVGAARSEDTIQALLVENKDGRSAIAADMVVDASGDADVCHYAGESTTSAATNRRAGWFVLHRDGRLEIQKLNDRDRRGDLAGDRAEHVTAMNIAGRRMIREQLQGIWEDEPAAYPAVIPTLPLFRMTRRLQGRDELALTDEGSPMPDAVGLTGDWRKPGPRYAVPYRALTGRNTNLLAAGRCIAVSSDVWDITRAIPTCAVTGEAAGTAAALAAAKQLKIQELPLKALQQQLIRQGVLLDFPAR